METSLTKDTELKDLFQPLTKGQRLYLCLRLADYPKANALKIISKKHPSLDRWENEDGFKALEEYVLSNADKYKEQALDVFTHAIGLKATMVLENLVDMGLDWDNLDRFDKPYVMQAAQLFKRLSSSKKGVGEGSYDEIILRQHRER